MLNFQILFDIIIFFGLAVLFFIILSTRKRVKQFRDSYLSLKELSDNFDNLIDRCEVEGGKLLDQLEKEKVRISELLIMVGKKQREIDTIESRVVQKLEVPESIEDHGESDDSTSLQEHLQNKYREIYKLADEGKTLKQIEKILELPVGEIELILSLRK